jgi:hypothetical protein
MSGIANAATPITVCTGGRSPQIEWTAAPITPSLAKSRPTTYVAPDGEPLLTLLDEGAPALPLTRDTERDDQGWALLNLCFERSLTGAARHLLQLGALVEVLEPTELRDWMAHAATSLAALYDDGTRPRRGSMLTRR